MTIKRYGTSSMPCDSGIYVLYSEHEKVVVECERLRMQRYELMGVVADVERGNGFDATCLETIKRVIGELAEVA